MSTACADATRAKHDGKDDTERRLETNHELDDEHPAGAVDTKAMGAGLINSNELDGRDAGREEGDGALA